MGTVVSFNSLLRLSHSAGGDAKSERDCREPFFELDGCVLANASRIHGDVRLSLTRPSAGDFPRWMHDDSDASVVKISSNIEAFSPEGQPFSPDADASLDPLPDWFGTEEPGSRDAKAAEFGFLEAVHNLVLCASVSAPGTFAVDWLESADRRFALKFNTDHLVDVLGTAKSLQWPPLIRLNACTVRDWMFRLPGFEDGRGSGQAGRALAAFSQSLEAGSLSGPIFLLWTMVGIEALYSRRDSEVQKQILRNSELLLGPRLANTKIFKEMYDFRSKFFHGAKDLPFAHRQPDNETWEMYWLDMSQHGTVATAMLIASLQQLIVRNWTGFDVGSFIVGQADRP